MDQPRLHPGETRHEYHHRLVAERLAKFEGISKLKRDRYKRRETYKKVHNTLAGHLRGEHGWRRIVGPPLALEELQKIHDGYHEISETLA